MIRKIRDALITALSDPEPEQRWTVEAGDRADVVRVLGDVVKPVAIVSLTSSQPTAESLGCSALATTWQVVVIGANPDQALWIVDELQTLTRSPGWLPEPWLIRAQWDRTDEHESDSRKAAALSLELAIDAELP